LEQGKNKEDSAHFVVVGIGSGPDPPPTPPHQLKAVMTTLIKKKMEFASYIGKFGVVQLQSHMLESASLNMGKCANISPYMRRPLVIYDFATAPF
jgi:hypothetical protein